MAEPFAYLRQDQPGPEVLALLGVLPKRWGRMDRISRLAVVEVGRVLRDSGLLREDPEGLRAAGIGGLIGAGRFGSLATDLEFAATLAGGVQTASPLLFGYTLPNIALAEAASHFGLTGPVYSLFSGVLAEAEAEARRWLAEAPAPDFMVAGVIDVVPVEAAPHSGGVVIDAEIVAVNFTIVRPECPI